MQKGVSAAEKYAEGPRPLCECHGEEMYWNKDVRLVSGGSWRCKVYMSTHTKTYQQTPKYKRYNRIRSKTDYHTPGTAFYERNNPNGSRYGEKLRKNQDRYHQTAQEQDEERLWQLLNSQT